MSNDAAFTELAGRAEQPVVFRVMDEAKTQRFARPKERAPASLADLQLSPHLKASISFAFRDAQQARTARLWRTSFFVLLFGGMLPIAGALTQIAMTARVQPFLIEKDRHGYVVVTGPAKALKNDDPRVVMSSLRDWVVCARSVVRDRPAQDKHVQKVWSMVAPDTLAHRKVSAWFTEARLRGNPRRSIDVDEVHVAPIAESERVWKVEWTEVIYEDAHGTGARTRHSALVTIAFAPSDLEERIQLNAHGVFLVDIAITNF